MSAPNRAAPAAAAGSLPCTSAAFAELSADILRRGAALRFQAHGASMQPLVRDGDVLLVCPAAPASLRIGDVVLYRGGLDHVVVHRVVRKLGGPGERRFVLQGDALSRPDGEVPGSQIYGRVAAIQRDGATIDLDQAAMRVLGRLEAWRSRWGLGRGRTYRLAARLLRALPAFSKQLA